MNNKNPNEKEILKHFPELKHTTKKKMKYHKENKKRRQIKKHAKT